MKLGNEVQMVQSVPEGDGIVLGQMVHAVRRVDMLVYKGQNRRVWDH